MYTPLRRSGASHGGVLEVVAAHMWVAPQVRLRQCGASHLEIRRAHTQLCARGDEMYASSMASHETMRRASIGHQRALDVTRSLHARYEAGLVEASQARQEDFIVVQELGL